MVLKIGDFMYKSHLSKYYLPHVLCVLRTAHTRAACTHGRGSHVRVAERPTDPPAR
jgi:hypothetical protein